MAPFHHTLCSVFPIWPGFSSTIFAVTLLFPQPHPHQSCAHPCGCHSCSRRRHWPLAPGQLAQAEARGRCAQGVGDGEDAGRLVAGPGKDTGDRACEERGPEGAGRDGPTRGSLCSGQVARAHRWFWKELKHSFQVLGMVSASSGARLSPAERTKSCGNPVKQLENTWALSPGSRDLSGPCRGVIYTAVSLFSVYVHIHIHACIMYIHTHAYIMYIHIYTHNVHNVHPHISTHTHACACTDRTASPSLQVVPGGARRYTAGLWGSVSGYVWSPPSCSSCHRQLVCLLRVRACDGHSHILPFLLQN